MAVQTLPRKHRTALVVDARKGVNTERLNRLLQSVNGTGIKVDVFTLGQPVGPGLVAGAPNATQTAVGDVDVDVAASAKASGFSMLVTVTAL